MRRIIMLLCVMAMMLAMGAGVALAVTLVGNDGPNTLVGTNENDVLKGRGGADELVGKDDSDQLVGGRGNDSIDARESVPEEDRVDCGRGRDTVLTDDTTEDQIASNCEIVIPG